MTIRKFLIDTIAADYPIGPAIMRQNGHDRAVMSHVAMGSPLAHAAVDMLTGPQGTWSRDAAVQGVRLALSPRGSA